MLSLLKLKDEPELTGMRGFLRRITTPSVTARARCVGNTGYVEITCEKRKKGIDWRMIEAYSLDCSERLLLPADMELPLGTDLRRINPVAFRRRMLENAALDILSKCSLPPEHRRIAVYGQEAETVRLLPRLASLCGEIRIITRRAYAIADAVMQFSIKTGVPVGVTDQFDAAGFDMLLAPAGGAVMFELSPSCVVLAPDRPSIETRLWLSRAVPSVPRILEAAYDRCFDVTEFVGAFYEVGGMREFASITPIYAVTKDGICIELKGAAAFIGSDR